jgi:hypothetical protein
VSVATCRVSWHAGRAETRTGAPKHSELTSPTFAADPLANLPGRRAPRGLRAVIMGRPSPVDDERWRDEAQGVVLGDDVWRYVTAGLTLDRSVLMALYEHRPTAARTTVTLLRDKFRTVRARAREIHRQLGLWPTPIDRGDG